MRASRPRSQGFCAKQNLRLRGAAHCTITARNDLRRPSSPFHFRQSYGGDETRLVAYTGSATMVKRAMRKCGRSAA